MDTKAIIASLLCCLASSGLMVKGQRPAVEITPPDQNVARFEGESYFVSCKSADNKQSEKVWMDPKNNRILSSEHSRIRTEASIGLELYLNNIRSEDFGVYTCSHRVGGGLRAGFNLTVVRPIKFDTRLAVQSAPEGKDFTMKCHANGHSGPPTIVWRIDGRAPQGRFKAKNENLLIRGVVEADARSKFVCRAMDVNSARPDTKDMTIVLKVQIKPRIIGPPKKDQYGVEGQWANLTCAVVADPPARFQWHFGSRGLLSNTNEYQVLNQTENVSVLQMLIRKAQDFGDYKCQATNSMGSAMQVLALKRAKKPGIPTLEVLHVGSTGVAVRVKNPQEPSRYNDPAADGDRRARTEDLPINGYSVQFKMLRKETWVTASNVTVTSYGFILRNLIPNVTYFIRAASRNQAAQGNYSTDLQVSTPLNVPFNPPLNGVQSVAPLLPFLLTSIMVLCLASRLW